MKVQHSESTVKPRFSSNQSTDKNSDQSHENIKNIRTSESAVKGRTIGHANCNYYILEYNKHMGENVLRLRVLHNLSIKEFAEKLRVSPQQLYKYENGINKISGKVLASIARVLYSNIDSRTNSRLDKKIFLEMIIDHFDFKVGLQELKVKS